jgi:hypothetical protein
MGVLALDAGTDEDLSRQSIFPGDLSDRARPEPSISKNREPQGAREEAEFMCVMGHRHGAVGSPQQEGIVGAGTSVVRVRIT